MALEFRRCEEMNFKQALICVATILLLGIPVIDLPAFNNPLLSLPACGASTGCQPPQTRDDPTKIIRARAYSGEPFGVARVDFRTGYDPLVLQTGAIRVEQELGRVMYPAYSDTLTRLLKTDPELARAGIQTVWFLFQGNEPFEISLSGASEERVLIEPNDRPVLARAAFSQWWRQFNLQMQSQARQADYPPLVETYLPEMLAKRVGRSIPLMAQGKQADKGELTETLDLIFDVESVRTKTIRELMRAPGVSGTDSATIQLPNALEWPAIRPLVDDQVDVEAIASRVPEECFYVRFGNWDNQLWLTHLLEEYGNDLSQMVALRGYAPLSADKMMDQLVLESGGLGELFGGRLVSDMAIIGRDFYIEDGPAIGVLFETKLGLFETNMRSQRRKFARQNKEDGVTLEEIEIAGQQVTLLSSEDNRVRSFYAINENYHLVTTSRAIVERFFAAAEGDRSLAQHPEFRAARVLLPVEREDTIFIYLSRPFFDQFLTPQFQIELSRRIRSLTNVQLLQMALWAAQAEGFAIASIDDLIIQGFLPNNFGSQPDGSTITQQGDWWIDSARGRRGYFVPIADVNVDRISPSEADWLNQRRDYFRDQLGQFDPILAGIKRFDLGEGVERVVIDARVAPFGGNAMKTLLGMSGEQLPLDHEIATSPHDLISLQLSMNSPFSFLGGGAGEHTHWFGGIQNDVPPATNLEPQGFLEKLKFFKSIPGYVGTFPAAGVMDLFPALGGEPDAAGYTYSTFLQLWRLQWGEFSVISFDRDRLESLKPHLDIVPSEAPADFRLRVGDIADSNLRGWINLLYYQRGWETSIANVKFLNLLQQQFGLSDEELLSAANELLGVRLRCSLGGEYVLTENSRGRNLWTSTNWPQFRQPNIPDGFEAPPMQWFRGMNLDGYVEQGQIVVHGWLDIQRTEEEKGSLLPSFDLFKGFREVEDLPPPFAPGQQTDQAEEMELQQATIDDDDDN